MEEKHVIVHNVDSRAHIIREMNYLLMRIEMNAKIIVDGIKRDRERKLKE